MSKLFIFGDSFSCRFNNTFFDDYTKWKGYVPKYFGDIISNELAIHHHNYAKLGSDNYTIFESICNNITKVKPNDMMIIGWTSRNRFRIVDTNNLNWKMVTMNSSNTDNTISKQSIDELFLNRSSVLYAYEVNSWIHLLNSLLPNTKIINWCWSEYEKEINALNLPNMETIGYETNGELKDMHYNELGHLQLSDVFLKELQKNKINKFV